MLRQPISSQQPFWLTTLLIRTTSRKYRFVLPPGPAKVTDMIREGTKLKKVTKEDKSNSNGLESVFQQAMDKRRSAIQPDIEDNVDCFAFNKKPKECKEEKRCEWRKDSGWDDEFGCYKKEQTGGFDRYLMAFKK